MSILATDNFNRADNLDVGANWTVLTSTNAARIVSNAVRADVLGNDHIEYWNALSWPNNQYVSMTIVAIPSAANHGPGPMVRAATAAQTGYMLYCGSSTTAGATLWKAVNTSWTALGTRDADFTAGDTVTLEVQGTTLVIKKNGVQVGASYTDSTISSGQAGFIITFPTAQGDSILDNWEGGDFAAADTLFAQILL